jgi:pSer/pThr/pTyr-binding forkhead associated (FHA) protein
MIRLVLNYQGSDLPTHELGGDFVFIGRHPLNHIVINHPAVSAQHALLLRVRHSYWLKDLDSTNGTQINGVLITDAELKDGDKIRFGSVLAAFVGACCNRTSKRGFRKFWTSIAV